MSVAKERARLRSVLHKLLVEGNMDKTIVTFDHLVARCGPRRDLKLTLAAACAHVVTHVGRINDGILPRAEELLEELARDGDDSDGDARKLRELRAKIFEVVEMKKTVESIRCMLYAQMAYLGSQVNMSDVRHGWSMGEPAKKDGEGKRT